MRYWRQQISSPSLRVNGNGSRIPRESPEFMDALTKTSKHQFVLVDAGFLRGKVDPQEIDEVVPIYSSPLLLIRQITPSQ